MDFQLDDTIAALATAAGPAARGIIRVSGPDVLTCLQTLFDADEPLRWQTARYAGRHAGLLRIGKSRLRLPVSVYLWPNGRSYTGQVAAELHTIGSPPLLEAVLEALFEAGVRPARRGEFTLRAFLAGKIDLMQAEAVLGVIDAFDHQELETALQQLAGGVSGRLSEVREHLVHLLADLEAGLDFVEEDIEFIQRQELTDEISRAHDDLRELLQQASERMRSTGRWRVVLAGLPNAGKSTLFNALAGKTAALVSEVLGTTRDYLSVDLDWHGMAVEVIDTAGWEASAKDLLRRAQDFRSDQLERADLIVWCTARGLHETLHDVDKRLLDQVKQRLHRPVVSVETMCDLPSSQGPKRDAHVCSQTGEGLSPLIDAMTAKLAETHLGARHLLGSTVSRCRESLTSTLDALDRARSAALENIGDEIVALEIRDALEHLGRILGTVYTDDILDRIFSKFCIGK